MRARDVMITDFDKISPDATLFDAAAIMRESRKGMGEGGVPALVVLDGDRLVGIVSLTDMLKAILPPYLLQDTHLAHVTWDGLLESQCKRVQDKKVRDIMTRDVVTVKEDAVLAEAAEHFLSRHIHSIPVLRGTNVVGILYLYDLAKRVFSYCQVGAS
ncbi:MAG: CBS domain-containing protein [Nitrospirota bacterium]